MRDHHGFMIKKELNIKINKWWHFIRVYALSIAGIFAMFFIFWAVFYMPKTNTIPVVFIIISAFTVISFAKDDYYKQLEIDRLNKILKENNIDNEVDKSHITK